MPIELKSESVLSADCEAEFESRFFDGILAGNLTEYGELLGDGVINTDTCFDEECILTFVRPHSE